MSHHCYYPRIMLPYRYGDCSSDKCNFFRMVSIRKESISTGKRHHVNSINVIVLLRVIYYNLLSSAIYTIIAVSNLKLFIISEVSHALCPGATVISPPKILRNFTYLKNMHVLLRNIDESISESR
jgi:hypothetical protein